MQMDKYFKSQKGFIIAPVILWIVGALVLTGTVAIKEGLISVDLSEKITHDGSRTGARVGYQSYCNPEQGVVIYENEKMPFVTDEGERVLWTRGDIDCYKEKKLQVATIPTPKPTSTPTFKPVKPVYVDPDPIINCESSYPNCKGSSIKVRKSQCSKITCCQIGSNWSIYPTTDKCSEDQKNYWSKVYSPPATGNSNNIPSTPSEPTITCVLSHGTYQLSQSNCDSFKKTDQNTESFVECVIDGVNLTRYTQAECDKLKLVYGQAELNQQINESLKQDQQQVEINQHNSQVTSCRSGVGSLSNYQQSCSQYGGSAATACRQIAGGEWQAKYNACGTLY